MSNEVDLKSLGLGAMLGGCLVAVFMMTVNFKKLSSNCAYEENASSEVEAQLGLNH